MKYMKTVIAAILSVLLLCGCAPSEQTAQIAATTLEELP